MKNDEIPAQPSRLTADSQKRLLAYSTAAGLGAFFAGQNAQAAVVQAPGLAPYPHVIVPQPVGSTNPTDLYIKFDGGSVTNFDLYIGPDLLSHPTQKYPAQLIDIYGIVPDTNNPTVVNGVGLTHAWDDATANAYCGSFFGGDIIGNNASTFVASYAPRLALAYNGGGSAPYYHYHWNNYPGFPLQHLGFKFTGSDGQNHFGYMDVQVNFVNATVGVDTAAVVKSVVINDCRYETTPNAGITVPSAVKITSFTQDPTQSNLITIDFGPNWDDDNTPTYVLETSPTLGPSAAWVTDPQAIVFQTATGSTNHVAAYQALTYPTTNATKQYWRVKKQ